MLVAVIDLLILFVDILFSLNFISCLGLSSQFLILRNLSYTYGFFAALILTMFTGSCSWNCTLSSRGEGSEVC